LKIRLKKVFSDWILTIFMILTSEHIDVVLEIFLKHYNLDGHHVLGELFSWNQLYRLFAEKSTHRTIEIIEREVSKIKNKKVIIFPIMCDLGDDYFDYTIDLSVNTRNKRTIVRHWILAIIFIEERKVELYDSLNIEKILNFWEDILDQFLKTYFKNGFIFERLGRVTHQKNGKNCGYYILLYTQLHILGFSIQKIRELRMINDDYIQNEVKEKIMKIINKK